MAGMYEYKYNIQRGNEIKTELKLQLVSLWLDKFESVLLGTNFHFESDWVKITPGVHLHLLAFS